MLPLPSVSIFLNKSLNSLRSTPARLCRLINEASAFPSVSFFYSPILHQYILT